MRIRRRDSHAHGQGMFATTGTPQALGGYQALSRGNLSRRWRGCSVLLVQVLQHMKQMLGSVQVVSSSSSSLNYRYVSQLYAFAS